jgi:hypothetical protein
MPEKALEVHDRSLLTQGFFHTLAEENWLINICIMNKGGISSQITRSFILFTLMTLY